MSSFQEINALTQNHAKTFEFTEEDAGRILIDNEEMEKMLTYEDEKTKLERLHLQEIRLRMHSATLSEYWRNKRIPRGLRVQKAPAIGESDDAFMERWESILNKCSLDLMLLTIEQGTTEAQQTKAEIETLENNMKQKFGPDFSTIEQTIKGSVAKYKEELQTMKLSKYKRDAEDYKRNEVYKWQIKDEPGMPHQTASAPLRTRTPAPRRPARSSRPNQRGMQRPGRGYSTLESDFTLDSDSSGPSQAATFLENRRRGQRGGKRNAGGGSAFRGSDQQWTHHRQRR